MVRHSLILKNGGPKIVFEEWRQRTTRRLLQESDPTNESRIFDLMDMVKGIIGRNRDHCQEEVEVILSSIHDDMPENVDEHFAAPTNAVTQV